MRFSYTSLVSKERCGKLDKKRTVEFVQTQKRADSAQYRNKKEANDRTARKKKRNRRPGETIAIRKRKFHI